MTHLDIGYEFYLPDELLLDVVLDQVVVDPPLPVAEAVPGDVQRTLSGLNTDRYTFDFIYTISTICRYLLSIIYTA